MGESTVSLLSPRRCGSCRARRAGTWQDVGVALPVGAVGGDEDLAMLFEVHQPIGHGEVVDVEQLAMALERGRIFAVRVDHDDMPFRAHVADLVHDAGPAEVDLPVPVEPSSAKCLPRKESTSSEARMSLVGIDGADLDMARSSAA
jgi:hypothetical protein